MRVCSIIFLQALGGEEHEPARGDEVQPVHSDHRGHRLGQRDGGNDLADEARTQHPQQRAREDQDLRRHEREPSRKYGVKKC